MRLAKELILSYFTKLGILQSQVRSISRFDLYSLFALEFDEPSRLVRRHAEKQEGEPGKVGEQRHDSITTNTLLRQNLIWSKFSILAYRSGSRPGERLTK